MPVQKNQLVITRIFNAPRNLVWKAWTDPVHFRRWWGPKRFTCPAANTDFRVGGRYLWCMRSPEGKDYWSTGIFREIVPMERIVYTDSFADEKGNIVPASYYGLLGHGMSLEFQVTIILEDLGSTTKMTLTHAGFPEGEVTVLASAGWNESFDKLAASLK
ncbi:MAG: SRPBCC domain-containing protein [Bacteroidota bacterium]|jgi:uncharacterized protein YndB with AHSA1/START domain